MDVVIRPPADHHQVVQRHHRCPDPAPERQGFGSPPAHHGAQLTAPGLLRLREKPLRSSGAGTGSWPNTSITARPLSAAGGSPARAGTDPRPRSGPGPPAPRLPRRPAHGGNEAGATRRNVGGIPWTPPALPAPARAARATRPGKDRGHRLQPGGDGRRTRGQRLEAVLLLLQLCVVLANVPELPLGRLELDDPGLEGVQFPAVEPRRPGVEHRHQDQERRKSPCADGRDARASPPRPGPCPAPRGESG